MSSNLILIPENIMKPGELPILFPLAICKGYEMCIETTRRVQEDFKNAVGVDWNAGTLLQWPGLGPVHFVAVTTPECLPERLEISIRLMDFSTYSDGNG